jgi:predicted PurR-regulated permease PerM
MRKKWSELRRRQQEIRRVGSTPTTQEGAAETAKQLTPDFLTDALPIGADARASSGRRDYGTAGRPLNRQSPFYVGFVGAFGVLVAYGLYKALGQLTQVFTGVLGAGKALASGFFSFLTVLVLTLYLLASLPKVKHAAYGMVPASRRARFISLSEEIMRRVGGYAIGQVAVATINAICSYIMMSIVGIRYAAVLAVAVAFLGLLPMVGASLGAAVVAMVAFFDDPKKAAIALIYYVVYQQLENYVVAPRIMQRTISVPGAITVVAALAGGTLLGILGALLAIPVAAGLLLIYEEVLLPRQHQS